MPCCTVLERDTEIEKMTVNHQQLERFFYEARRNAFLVSFFYFIGSVAGLGALTMLDPELGIIIPILGGVWIIALTIIFLYLTRMLFQLTEKVTKMMDTLFAEIMKEATE